MEKDKENGFRSSQGLPTSCQQTGKLKEQTGFSVEKKKQGKEKLNVTNVTIVQPNVVRRCLIENNKRL